MRVPPEETPIGSPMLPSPVMVPPCNARFEFRESIDEFPPAPIETVGMAGVPLYLVGAGALIAVGVAMVILNGMKR